MVIPKLSGGLGNQMFQVANACAYAKRYELDWGINYGLSFCPNQGFTASKYKDNLFKNIPTTTELPTKVYRELSMKYHQIPKMCEVLFDGYFQSEKYFEDATDIIRSLFVFPKDIEEMVDSFLNTLSRPIVGVHIRRGDYIKFSNVHAIHGVKYYSEASKIVGKHSSVVCTDDWNSVNKEMSFSNATKSPFKNEIEDLCLLSKCDFLVLCNSSFSWWSSFLIKEKTKVVAPKNWLIDRNYEEYKDVFRKNWILL